MSSADVDPVGMCRIYCAVKKKWRTLLLDKIADVNLCAALFTERYVIVIGREVNAISVEVMWDHLEKVVQRIHLRECPRQAKSHYRESFKLGIASGISEKLEEQFQINTDPTQYSMKCIRSVSFILGILAGRRLLSFPPKALFAL